jgi:hypothetical protein
MGSLHVAPLTESTTLSPPQMMDADTRRRALSGDLGEDAQRYALAEITSTVAEAPSLLTSRQKFVAIVLAVLLMASIIALAALRLSLPASLARKAAGS